MFIAAERFYTAWSERDVDFVITGGDLHLIRYLIDTWADTDREVHVVEMLDRMIEQDDGLTLLESLAASMDDRPEAGEFLQEWLYDRLRQEPRSPSPLCYSFDDFIRLLMLLVDYDAPPFTLRHVEIWLRHWIRDASLALDLIFDMAPIDATDLSCVRKQTPATLLEACRARWLTEPGPDMDRLCDSLSALYVTYALRVTRRPM